MRSSADMSPARVARPRRRIILIVIAVALVALFFGVRWFAWLYTQSLWFSSIHQHEVFSTMYLTKAGLFLVFGLVFFLVMWGNLLLCSRLGPSELFLDAPEDELVRRFQSAVRPYAGRLYALLAFLLALIAASATLGRWEQYLLFANAKSFHKTDPLFHMDIGFYVFRLPFLTFVVDWVLASLLATIVVVAIFHYLNGGIRAARVSPRVSPGVKIHLSVLLALLAIAKAAGYLVARWHMVTSTTNGVVEGAGYTDVHARLPALMLLFWLCLLAAIILLINIWQRGWTLPLIAVGLWAFVALLIGVIYPAILQAAKVTPAQSSLEQPYIQRNIDFTRAAYAISAISPVQWGVVSSKKPLLTQPGVEASLSDIREWDPSPQISQVTFQQYEGRRNYYTITQLGEDRYVVNHHLVPVLEGVRELNTAGLTNPTWVNQHLQYTHGIGIVMVPANKVQTSTGRPVFTEADVPPKSTDGFPAVTVPQIYYGLGQSGFVVADTKQKELDYERSKGEPLYKEYGAQGGVPLTGFFRRAMYAIRFGDLNLVLSNLIDTSSRIIYYRNVMQIAQQAAPFLSIDAHPYAAIVGGHVDWILDGYTTTDQYPYSQNASTQLVPSDTGLPSSYNYARNSVKIVVDAYTGQVTLYAMDSSDPILQAWESVFPGLIQPLGAMPTELQQHLKYPEDIFSIQAAIFGRYHITSASAFYSNSDGWSLTPTDGAGQPSDTIQTTNQLDKQGFIVSTTISRMDPLYQVYALPGSASPQYTMTDAYVAASAGGSTGGTLNVGVLNLTGFMVALSDPKHYGTLRVYRPPSGAITQGPVQADSAMSSYPPASTKISYLDQHGSKVLLGNVLMVPINGSMLYVRPMYVSATATTIPLLQYFIAVYKSRRSFATTLQGALAQVLGTHGSAAGSRGLSADQLLTLAKDAYDKAVQVPAGNLALYQHYISLENRYVSEAQTLLEKQKVTAVSTPVTSSTKT